MNISRLFEPLSFKRGAAMKNRFMLAPLTTQQSFADGRMSEEELHWLSLRAKGGFGYVLTAATHVQAVGQGFPGQIGVFGDKHVEGLSRLAAGVKAHGAVACLQLYHAGNRAPREQVSAPVCPSDDPKTGARALTTSEVEALRDDFIAGAKRAEQSGFDGVEIHSAHGYILAQFLSPSINRRDDRYGGTIENRARLIFEIIDGVRAACRPDFQVGLRLSAERFDLRLGEIISVATEVFRQDKIDFFELSAWDVAKEPQEPEYRGRTLVSHFAELPRGEIRFGAAGKVLAADTAAGLIEAGCDFAVIGRAAILRHDFPEAVRHDPNHTSPALPVSAQYLHGQGLSPAFVNYMRTWPGFVADATQGQDHYAMFDAMMNAEADVRAKES